MNAEFPPFALRAPTIARLRPAKGRPLPQSPIDLQRSAERSRLLRAQIQHIQNHVRTLSPEQKRAVFLKLKHDRPLRVQDLAGTGLRPMSSMNGTETLVIPREENLGKLDRRLEGVETNQNPNEKPAGQDLGMAITAIEQGTPLDRLSPQLTAKFQSLITIDFIIYELEVTSFKFRSNTRRKEVERIVSDIRAFIGVDGRIYEVDYAGDGARILLSTTGAKFQQLVELPQWQRTITFFDERPAFQTFHQVVSNFGITNTNIVPPPEDAETICIIDSGVAAGNPLLAPVLRRDFCKSYVAGCEPTVDELDHGSGVASLAAYYDIDPTPAATLRPKAWIASARILTEDGFLDKIETDNEGIMRVRHARLLSRLLREIVADYRPRGVRIFVLAFNIVGHYWSEANRGVVSRNAWVARTIDQLSREFDVVFVTITGNIDAAEVQELHEGSPYPAYFTGPLAKILDPGQAALAVTSGSIAHSSRVAVANAAPIAEEGKPSPFTRAGPGFAGATKPDFVERGGNFVVEAETGRVLTNQTTSILMASNKLTPALRSDVGTSFSAPRIAYHLAVIAYELRQMHVEPSSALLRALLATSSDSPSQTHSWCETALGSCDAALSVIGYGLPSGVHALECSRSSVILHYQGAVEVGKVALFQIPVPIELADGGRGTKKIIVSVATTPPVQKWGLADYLGAELRFRLFRGDENPTDVSAFMALEIGSTQVRPHVGDQSGKFGITARSHGTLQRECFIWKQHSREYSAFPYTLAISLTPSDWLDAGESVPVAVAVRIEDETGSCTTLYASVLSLVAAEVQAQA